MLDAWLLKRFPGRTLEEIDEMDWTRYLRATEAQRIEDVEQLRKSQMAGTVKTLAADTWQDIKEHDRLIADAQ